MDKQMVLRRHNLRHLPELNVNENLAQSKFTESCSMNNCSSECCMGGVYADPAERDNILAHTELIQRYMEPQQEKDPSRWFDEKEVVDTDFPSGKAIGTRATEAGCVFLNRSGKCVLQAAAMAEGMDRFALKPFFCVAFPITIYKGELMVENPDFADQQQCCNSSLGGSKNIFDICSEELEFVIGAEGVRELKSLLHSQRTIPQD